MAILVSKTFLVIFCLREFSDQSVQNNVNSLKKGAFQFGPLNPHNQYDVQLAHDDYRFQQRTADENNFVFNSFELANIDIVINDENGQLLSDVVVVLSGPGELLFCIIFVITL